MCRTLTANVWKNAHDFLICLMQFPFPGLDTFFLKQTSALFYVLPSVSQQLNIPSPVNPERTPRVSLPSAA